jgi:hypothetical protein
VTKAPPRIALATVALGLSALAQSTVTAQVTAVPAPAFVTISGWVTDSIHAAPLVGAEVVVYGTTAVARTDSLGNFRIDSIPAGRYQLAVYHPLIDSLQTSLASTPLDFAPGATPSVNFAIPSRRTVLARLCKGDAVAQIVVIGQVRDVDSDAPIPGVRVTTALTRMSVAQNADHSIGLHKTVGSIQSVTDQSGSFHTCLPDGQQIQISARLGGARTGDIAYSPYNGVLFPMLRVARSDSALPVLDTLAPPTNGRATLVGTVRTADGKPLDGARVELAGTPRVTTTGRDGSYRFDSLPSGTQRITVERLGFPESINLVDLTAKSPKSLATVMAVPVNTLPTVDVKANQASITSALQRVGFTQRQKGTIGHFLTPDQIAKIDARSTTDLLSHVPGAREIYTATGRRIVAAGSAPADGGACTLYRVDYQQVFVIAENDDQVLPRPDDIIAVELYGTGDVAIGGSAPAAGCLAIQIWTINLAGG